MGQYNGIAIYKAMWDSVNNWSAPPVLDKRPYRYTKANLDALLSGVENALSPHKRQQINPVRPLNQTSPTVNQTSPSTTHTKLTSTATPEYEYKISDHGEDGANVLASNGMYVNVYTGFNNKGFLNDLTDQMMQGQANEQGPTSSSFWEDAGRIIVEKNGNPKSIEESGVCDERFNYGKQGKEIIDFYFQKEFITGNYVPPLVKHIQAIVMYIDSNKGRQYISKKINEQEFWKKEVMDVREASNISSLYYGRFFPHQFICTSKKFDGYALFNILKIIDKLEALI
eukprot:Nk52_evm22s277 gene=Nk52_evmTU22s277